MTINSANTAQIGRQRHDQVATSMAHSHQRRIRGRHRLARRRWLLATVVCSLTALVACTSGTKTDPIDTASSQRSAAVVVSPPTPSPLSPTTQSSDTTATDPSQPNEGGDGSPSDQSTGTVTGVILDGSGAPLGNTAIAAAPLGQTGSGRDINGMDTVQYLQTDAAGTYTLTCPIQGCLELRMYLEPGCFEELFSDKSGGKIETNAAGRIDWEEADQPCQNFPDYTP